MSPSPEKKQSHQCSETDEESDASDDEPPSKQVSVRPRKKAAKEFSVIRWRARGYKQQQTPPLKHDFSSALNTIQLDPATLVVSDLTDPEVKRVIHRTTNYYWPAFRVYLRDHNASVVDSWLEHTTGNAVLYHAMLRGHALMMMSNDPDAIWEHALPFIRKHTLASMKELRRMAERREHATDEMIHAAMYLSMTARPRSPRFGREGGQGFGLFSPPLQKLQALDSHVETYWVDPHVSAVRGMIKQRGGLDQLKMYGLPESVFSYDIHIAAQNFEMPELGLSNAAEDFLNTVMQPEREALLADVRAGNDSFNFSLFDLPQRLAEVLQDMRVYSSHVQSFLSGDPAPPQVVLALQRNIIVHHILTLPSYEASPTTVGLHAWTANLPSLVYITASLYCFGVVYPTLRWHPKQVCLDSLQRQLRTLLRRYGLDCLEPKHTRLLLWICMVGCMMAAGPNIYQAVDVAEDIAMVEKQQDTYLKILAWCRVRLSLDSFADVKEALQQWIWMEEACDEGGEIVWRMVTGTGDENTVAPIDVTP